MELSDYNITFVCIKGSSNILADVISRPETLHIYEEPLDDPKWFDTWPALQMWLAVSYKP